MSGYRLEKAAQVGGGWGQGTGAVKEGRSEKVRRNLLRPATPPNSSCRRRRVVPSLRVQVATQVQAPPVGVPPPTPLLLPASMPTCIRRGPTCVLSLMMMAAAVQAPAASALWRRRRFRRAVWSSARFPRSACHWLSSLPSPSGANPKSTESSTVRSMLSIPPSSPQPWRPHGGGNLLWVPAAGVGLRPADALHKVQAGAVLLARVPAGRLEGPPQARVSLLRCRGLGRSKDPGQAHQQHEQRVAAAAHRPPAPGYACAGQACWSPPQSS